jgi:hypothetical protein
MISDIGLIHKSRRGFFSQIEMADKVMMTFINSWKLKNFVNRIIWKSDRHITSEISGLKLFDNKFNPMGTVNTDDKGIYTLLLNAAKRIM